MEIDFFDSLFGEEESLDKHTVAWLSKDWDAVQKLADEFRESSESELFKIIDNITLDKKDILVGIDGDYSKYMVDTALSQHVDCISYVNAMNILGGGLSDQMHHDYYKLTIPKEKRYGKWASYKEDIRELLVTCLIKKVYNTNEETAKMYKNILTEKGKLKAFLSKNRFMITDDFYKSITKNNKDKNILKKIVEEWKNDQN